VAASVALPGLPSASESTADVEVELVEALPRPVAVRPRYRAGTADDPASRVEITDGADGRTHFRYGDGTAFDVAHSTRPATIRASIAPGQTLEDMSAYLYGPVLGFILRAWGRLALHASCVRIGDAAVLIAGASGAGKSTTAAALATRGARVLSDDLTALGFPDDGPPLAWPAFDHLRLWTDAERIVLGDVGRLERITPTWDKRRFALEGDDFEREPCPVAAIVVLAPRGPRRRTVARRIAAPRAVVTLATLSYANYLLDTRLRAAELAQLGALARAVPVHAVAPSTDPAGVTDLCDAIVRIASRHAPVRP
jgi:hypothetical protein